MSPVDIERASSICLSPPPGKMAGIFGDGACGLALRARARGGLPGARGTDHGEDRDADRAGRGLPVAGVPSLEAKSLGGRPQPVRGSVFHQGNQGALENDLV